ncbi:MAG: pilus assembly protein PilM [Elusimicrobia bacterium]|nr:pilus assembly protein PilM [Elusimicrobiota bacterium]
MNLEALAERLIFGSKRPRLGSDRVGLHVSSRSLCWLSASLQGSGGLKIQKVVETPFKREVPEGDTTTPFAGEEVFRDIPLKALVQEAWQELRSPTQTVFVSLSEELSLFRYYIMNPIPRRFWNQAIPLEAKKYIPFPLQGMRYDYEVLPLEAPHGKQQRLGILFCAAPEKVVRELLEVLEACGLQALAVEPATCSVGRFLRFRSISSASAGNFVHVHIDPKTAHVLLFQGGWPIFSRQTQLENGASWSNRRQINVGYCLEFARKQLGVAGMQKILLSGGGETELWRQHLQADAALPVEILGFQALGEPQTPARWEEVACLGALCKPEAVDFPSVNLNASARISRERQRVIFTVWAAAGLLSGLLLLASPLQWLRGWRYERTLQEHHQALAAALGGTASQGAPQLKQQIAELEDKIAATRSVYSRSVSIVSKLKAVAESIPEPAWIVDLGYQAQWAEVAKDSRQSLMMSGSVEGGSREEEIRIAQEFQESLTKNPGFFKGFSSVKPSYRKVASGAQGAQGAEKTEFSFYFSSEANP